MKLFWTDVETTGLIPAHDRLLEIGVYQAELEDPFNAKLVYHRVLNCVPGVAMHPDVRAFHEKSGLLAECEKSLVTFEAAEADLLTIVPEIEDFSDRPTLAGSSPHFDLGFIRRWMPKLAKRFSHRVFDVSAFKLLARSLGMEKIPKVEAHRVIDDIAESIAHGKLVVDWFKVNGFKQP